MIEEEILFSYEELNLIQESALKNSYLRDPMFVAISKQPTGVLTLSPIHGLIFAKGNEYTGFEHIVQRHQQSRPHWIKSSDENDNNYFRLQDQGLFRPDSVPIYDYCMIADSLYKNENLNVEKNKRPDLFEMYTGEHTHQDLETSKYNLLIYRGTKVVHTIYPQSNKNNPKRVKGFNYSRGGASSSWDFKNSITMIEIPYFDHNNIVRYLLIFRKVSDKLTVIIQINDILGNPWKSVFVGRLKIDFNKFRDDFDPFDVIRLECGDLRVLERKILELDKCFIKMTNQENQENKPKKRE